MGFMDELMGKKEGGALGPRAKEVTLQDRERLFFLMGMMFRAGQTSVDALRTVSKAFKNEGLDDIAAALHSMGTKVAQGRTMSKAMEGEYVLFTTVHRAAILAGEAANRMREAFEILRVLEDKKIEASRSGFGALLTPASLSVMSLLSLFNTGLNTLPVMSQLKKSQGKELPVLAELVMGFTHFCANYWYIIVAFFLIFAIVSYSFVKSAKGRWVFDGQLLNFPVLGKYISYKTYSQMLLYFPHLIESGVKPQQMTPIMEALSTNLVLKKRIDAFNQTINTGGKMSQAMERSGFPGIAVTPVAVSEHYSGKEGETNDVMVEGMHHAYNIMEREVGDTHKQAINMFSSILWIIGGGIMMAEMMSIVMTQA